MDEFDLTEKNLKIFMLQYCPWVRISALLPNINMNHFCYSKNKFKTLQIQWPPYFHLLGHVTELLSKHDSIGRASTEAKERKNKVCKKNHYLFIISSIEPFQVMNKNIRFEFNNYVFLLDNDGIF